MEQERVLTQLRVNQGLYAPMKLKMEREYASKANRLPCLKSSNLMVSVLKGTDETLEVEDIINSNTTIYPIQFNCFIYSFGF